MRIHTNTLGPMHVIHAAQAAGAIVESISKHGSRSHTRAVDIKLWGSSTRTNQSNTGHAATWDEWGIFLGLLFAQDDSIKATYYRNADEFHWMTGDRFRFESPSDAANVQLHANHRFEYFGTVATGSYYVYRCKCGAITRRMDFGHDFSEFS